MDELWDRFNSGEMLSLDSLKLHNNGKKYTTSCKDTLFGGDGISPTVFVPVDTSHAQQKMLRLVSDGKFNSYIYNYYLQNKKLVQQYPTATDYTNRFNGADILNDIIKAAPDSLQLKIISDNEKVLLQQRLKALLARYRWRDSGFYQVLNNEDIVVKKAVEIIAK